MVGFFGRFREKVRSARDIPFLKPETCQRNKNELTFLQVGIGSGRSWTLQGDQQ